MRGNRRLRSALARWVRVANAKCTRTGTGQGGFQTPGSAFPSPLLGGGFRGPRARLGPLRASLPCKLPKRVCVLLARLFWLCTHCALGRSLLLYWGQRFKSRLGPGAGG